VEIECGIDDRTTHTERAIRQFESVHDGSLQTDKPHAKHTEYVSNPVDYKDGLNKLETSIQQLYGIILEINASMGLHIHISLNNDRDYYRLASVKFHNWFIDRLKDTDLWNRSARLRKRVYNDDIHPYNAHRDYGYFCRPINNSLDIDVQLKRRARKYRRITFMKGKYDTIEFRLFPAMENPEDVMEAIDIVTTSINAYLREGLYSDTLESNLSSDDIENISETSFNDSIQSQVTYNV
jgi:hypothetical protein